MSFFSALRRRATSALAIFIITAAALLAVPAMVKAEAAPYPHYPPSGGCTISASDSTVQAGDPVTITGSGFPATATVQLALESTGASLGSVTTDGHGGFTDAVTIPSDASGADHILATSGSVTCSFSLSASAVADPVNTSRGTGRTSTASTGFASLGATLVAVALLGGGLLLVRLGRRRRAS